MIYRFLKSAFFKLDPEVAHQWVLSLARKYPSSAKIFSHPPTHKKYQIKLGELAWSFPVGLAAGLDKNAEALTFFSNFLFGSIEVGTVTPIAQRGNPKPRIFRLTREESLRNHMGFNSQGMEQVFRNIIRSPGTKCLGVNIGKNKTTPNEKALMDYLKLYQKFSPLADYLVINISSPNTPGIRDLQKSFQLEKILSALKEARSQNPCPLFIKISPDIELSDLDQLIQLASNFNLQGLIASNTTVIKEWGKGGISGKLLYSRAKKIRSYLLKNLADYPQLELIGVGGFSSFSEIEDYWREGGRAVQIYTSLIYQGPKILMDIKKGIDKLLIRENVDTMEEWFNKIS